MNKSARYSGCTTWIMALLLSALAGCGASGQDPILGTGATTQPSVTLTAPADGAANVATDTLVTAQFSKDMDPTTFNTTIFTLTGPGVTAVPGFVSYATGTKTVTFTPATPTNLLLAGTTYTATITKAAKDLSGNELIGNQAASPTPSNYVWAFTTATDVTPPTVTNTNPVDPTSTACLQKVVNATFSKAMDPTTINSSPAGTLLTFTIKETIAGTNVPGIVAYDVPTHVASFTASSDFSPTTNYTATITAAAKDLSGNAVVPKTWTFTSTAAACAPPVVQASILASAARYGVFGGTAGMTNTGNQTVITGSSGNTADIGTIATATSTVTGFHDSAPSDIYTEVPGVNEGNVTGKIYTCTVSTTGPTNASVNAASCTTATTARGDALAAYDALVAKAGGPDPGAGNLANLTLAPGVYTSASGSFKMEGGDLTLDAQGDSTATWVFQMATTLIVGGPGAAAPQSVILTNGALAKNVFWQVGSHATINAAGGGTMVGTIISQAGVSFSTAGNVAPVTLNGRALSLGASVTLVNTKINVPAP